MRSLETKWFECHLKQPMNPLNESVCLDNVSNTQANYSNATGTLGFVGADGLLPPERIGDQVNATNATWGGDWDESILQMINATYTWQDVVVYFLVALNGTQTILSPDFNFGGYGNSSLDVVIDLVQNITC